MHRNTQKTHCPKGHEYTPENTRIKVRKNGSISRECKTCNRAKDKTKDKVKMAVRSRRWLDENPERARKYWFRRALLSYGLTLEQYEEMLKRQDGKCAICKRAEVNRRLSIDHDHATGKVRGLLCNNCNSGLGQFKDNIDLMLCAIEYLRTHLNIPQPAQ